MDLGEYKTQLRLDPEAPNTGTWYARNAIQHSGKAYAPGTQLPSDLTNREVADLLDVNALTSVAPKRDDVQVPPHNGAPNQQGVSEDGVAHGNLQTANDPNAELTDEQKQAQADELARQQAAGEQGQSGAGSTPDPNDPSLA